MLLIKEKKTRSAEDIWYRWLWFVGGKEEEGWEILGVLIHGDAAR